MRPAIEQTAQAPAPHAVAGDPMRHVFEPVAGRCRRLRACALAGALHGRAAARGGTGIDRAILAGRVRFHDGLCVLDRRGRFEAARRYLSSLNL